MKFAKLIAVAALVWSPVAFSAINVGTLGTSATSFSGSLNPLGYTDYTFTIVGTGKGTMSGALSGKPGGLFIPPIDVQLYAGTNPAWLSPSMSIDFSPTSFSFVNLSAGTYTMRVDFGSGSLAGTMSVSGMGVAAPVPEAENFAMLLVGLSGVGVIGLRRRRRD